MSPHIPSDDLGHRLAADLAPRYRLVRRLGEGGMGVVFEFRDTLLDRAVAVKALRPELATAEAAERFVREARIVAQVAHPNIVPLLDVQRTSDGLVCHIMELVQGPTLRELLERDGPLPPSRVRAVGAQLLAALEHAHRLGVVHRDVKPSNIFVTGDLVRLGDFGIARAPHDDDETLTRPGQRMGTPPYMAPEQRAARPATPATDVYAAGLVLFEALTGRRITPAEVAAPATWARVPRDFAGPLRRALEPEPAARWANAAAFRDALLASAPAPSEAQRLSVLGVLAIVAALVGFVAWQLARAGAAEASLPAPRADVAVAELRDEGTGGGAALVGRQLFSVLEQFQLLSVVRRGGEERHAVPARFTVGGTARPAGADSIVVQLEIRDSTGRIFQYVTAHGESDATERLGLGLADSIVCQVDAAHCQAFRDVRDLVGNVQAQKLYFEGEDAFTRGDWAGAERLFAAALERAPHYPLAAWNLMIARRYQRKDFGADLRRLAAPGSGLHALQRGLAEAQLEPDLFARFARYEALVRAYPTSGKALLLYYNERFHRGPLVGIPLAETLDSMSRLSTEFSDMHHTSQYDLTIWGYVRLGNEAAARREHARRQALAAAGDDYGPLHLHAIHSRFAPRLAWLERRWLAFRADSGALAVLAEKDRLGLSMDIPEAQVHLGLLLAERGWSVSQRGTGLVGQAMGHVMLGRPRRGLALLDSAAALLATREMRLQQAEWPVALAAFGVPVDAARLAAARSVLEQDAGDGEPRAAFLLGIDALRAGDTLRAMALVEALRRDSTEVGRRLGTLLAAEAAGAAGRHEEALAVSRVIFRLDDAAYAAGPFARALAYAGRGRWLEALGEADAADAAWRWYENSDMVGWPVGPPQQGEVDAMLGAWGRLVRAELAARRGDAAAACPHVERLRELWRDAEPGWAPLLARLARVGEAAGCR